MVSASSGASQAAPMVPMSSCSTRALLKPSLHRSRETVASVSKSSYQKSATRWEPSSLTSTTHWSSSAVYHCDPAAAA